MSPFPTPTHARGSAPRCVAHLAFSESLVIWALRRYNSGRRAAQARAAALAPEFSRAFGLARLEDTLAAFATLADSLATAARLPQAVALVEEDRINATEEAVLATLAALQRGDQDRAEALSEWCLLPAGRQRFVAAASRLARTMREAGHLIPCEAKQHAGAPLTGAGGEALLSPVGCLKGLEASEVSLVKAVRLWVCAFRLQQDALAAARRHFEPPDSPDSNCGGDAGLSLHAILRNTTLAAARPVDVRRPSCPGLSPDEARLLEATAWLQRGVAEPAARALGDWLPPAALRLSLCPARGLAEELLTAGLVLPLRHWDFAALAADAEAPHHAASKATAEDDRLWRAPGDAGARTLH